jgi:2-polyprenyl-3-methyl-5-hydroxy-6-metoxy-1,4-benzoquinol methylase
MKCRYCNSKDFINLVNLGHSPVSNDFLSTKRLRSPEIYYPLEVYTCKNCWLTQTIDYLNRENHFSDDYAYFSSTSSTFVEHAKLLCERIVLEFNLDSSSFVCEIASNDGYLLKNFVRMNIPHIGIEPTSSTAAAARESGVDVIENFFGSELINSHQYLKNSFDIIIGNNVYAHVPDINDFTASIFECLKDNGIVILEFPHIKNLLLENQFDTIYHEHYSYLSLTTVQEIFHKYGLFIFDVEEINTHGGSLRIFGSKKSATYKQKNSVENILIQENLFGLTNEKTYLDFQPKVERIRKDFNRYINEFSNENKNIVGYGAAAKGNTFLNYCGINHNDIKFIVDGAVSKQGKYAPGSHIPVVPFNKLYSFKADIIIIFPWNIKKEICKHLKDNLEYDPLIMTCIPDIRVEQLSSVIC